MVSVLSTRRGRALGAVAATLSLFLLSGCAAILDELGTPQEAPRDEPGGEVTASAEADIFSLKVGDCIDMDALEALYQGDSAELDAVPVVPCADAHTGEVFGETTLPEGDYPGEEAVSTAADDFCLPAFTDFVGLTYDESIYQYFPFTPTSEGWTVGADRVIQCVIVTEEPVTASLQGAAQ